jgi:hypothetical protein
MVGHITVQQAALVRFTEVHPVSLHHKAVHVAAFVTCTQTVPQLLLCIDHQTRFVVIMEGTQTYKLLAALRESDAAATNERHQLIRPFHPLDLSFVDQHPIRSSPIDSDSPNEPTLTGNATQSHSALPSYLAWPKRSMFQWKIWWALTEPRNAALVQPAG